MPYGDAKIVFESNASPHDKLSFYISSIHRGCGYLHRIISSFCLVPKTVYG